MDLCQIHTEDVFDPSLGRVEGQGQRSTSPGTKTALLAACVQLMFGKTSLASS